MSRRGRSRPSPLPSAERTPAESQRKAATRASDKPTARGTSGRLLSRFLPYLAAGLVCAILALRWFAAMGPATEHELASFCLPLHPDPGNEKLGKLPVAAPSISAVDIDGRQRTLDAYRGRVVLVNFWATWCPPCREEMPGLLKLADAVKDDPRIRVVAIANDQSWGDVSRYFASIGVKKTALTLLLDTQGAASHAFGTDKLPETYVVDPAGQVRYYFINTRDFGDPAAVRCLESLAGR